MSLAQELFDDLDDFDDTFDEDDIKAKTEVKEEPMDEGEVDGKPILPEMGRYDRIEDVAMLTRSQRYKDLVAEVQNYASFANMPKLTAPIEHDMQYKLVVKLSELATDIDQEVNVVHKFVRDKYEKRFPELESLVPMPFDYIRTVKLLGNDVDTKGQNKNLLASVLPPATCIVVSVMASTTQGKPLEADQLQVIFDACVMANELFEHKMGMHQFVEQRMNLIAPNLCRIVGAGTAAMLVAQAGGLGPLAKLPSDVMRILGKQKKTLSGFSGASLKRHSGFIYYHPSVQFLPPHARDKAARVIAGKCTLATRVDFLHSSPNGSVGESLARQAQEKIQKLVEPPPVKIEKALPRPIDKASKKRGGRRARADKKRFGQTELSKKANRMNFGEIQEEIMQNNIGFTPGRAKRVN